MSAANESALSRLQGNEGLKRELTRMLQGGRMGHSLLLVGEKGLGAGFAVRCLAADILYPGGGPMADAMVRGECCRAVSGSGSDSKVGDIETGVVREAVSLSPEGAGNQIKVSQVRAARNEIYNSALGGTGRVLLIYGAEYMNGNAANALLKVLEEPPEAVTFLLTASSLSAVLPTIRSRCGTLAMAEVSPAVCERFCAQQGVDAAQAARLTRVFGGKIGTVLNTARSPKLTALLQRAEDILHAVNEKKAYRVAVLLAGFESAKERPDALQLTDFLCAAAATAFTGANDICPLTPAQAACVVREADEARAALKGNGNVRLVTTRLSAHLAAL